MSILAELKFFSLPCGILIKFLNTFMTVFITDVAVKKINNSDRF